MKMILPTNVTVLCQQIQKSLNKQDIICYLYDPMNVDACVKSEGV